MERDVAVLNEGEEFLSRTGAKDWFGRSMTLYFLKTVKRKIKKTREALTSPDPCA